MLFRKSFLSIFVNCFVYSHLNIQLKYITMHQNGTNYLVYSNVRGKSLIYTYNHFTL